MRRFVAAVGLVAVSLMCRTTDAQASGAGAPQWTTGSAGNVLPSELLGDASSTAFDAATGQVVLAGGTTGTWTWDGRTWTRAQPRNSPIPRYRPVLAYDDATRRVVLFGGDTVPGVPGSPIGSFNDTWTWNGQTWQQKNPQHHPASGACAGYDQATGQFLMLGGSSSPATKMTWTWNGTDWTEVLSSSVSGFFTRCSMAYDPDLHAEVLLSGDGLDASMLWSWDGQAWSVLQSALPWQTFGWGATADSLAYDAATNQIVALVDSYPSPGSMPVRQGWAMTGDSWSRIDGPVPMGFGRLTTDPATHQIVAIMETPGAEAPETWVYAAPGASPATPTRVFGLDREQTAVTVSKSAFPMPDSASAVVLARADAFADAIAGGPLAAEKAAPLLLTSSDSLDPATQAEILRVLPAGGTVYILGGPAALSESVANEIESLGDVATRIAGVDRFATATAVAHEMGDPTTVFEASGTNFPDGLAAAPAAIATHGAILLTDGPAQSQSTAAYLTAHPGPRYAVGGAAATADPSATALVGADRYATAATLARAFFPDATALTIASGLGYSDALASGVASGLAAEPILLVPPNGPLPEAVTAYIVTHASEVLACTVIGGVVAVSDSMVYAVGATLSAQ